jgi:hypothetical protein
MKLIGEGMVCDERGHGGNDPLTNLAESLVRKIRSRGRRMEALCTVFNASFTIFK